MEVYLPYLINAFSYLQNKESLLMAVLWPNFQYQIIKYAFNTFNLVSDMAQQGAFNFRPFT